MRCHGNTGASPGALTSANGLAGAGTGHRGGGSRPCIGSEGGGCRQRSCVMGYDHPFPTHHPYSSCPTSDT